MIFSHIQTNNFKCNSLRKGGMILVDILGDIEDISDINLDIK